MNLGYKVWRDGIGPTSLSSVEILSCLFASAEGWLMLCDRSPAQSLLYPIRNPVDSPVRMNEANVWSGWVSKNRVISSKFIGDWYTGQLWSRLGVAVPANIKRSWVYRYRPWIMLAVGSEIAL